MASATYTNVTGGDARLVPSSTFTAIGSAPGQSSVTAADADQFVIQGPGGYSIHLFSAFNEDEPELDPDGDEGGNFSYTGEGSKIPTTTTGDSGNGGGTITEVQIRDTQGNIYLDVTGSFSDASLVDFYNTLQSSGAKAALDQLIGNNLTEQGSGQTDYVETYGQNGIYNLGGGNSFLDITYPYSTAYADGGNDTFTIDRSGLAGLQLHGGYDDGAVTPISTIDFNVPGTLAFQAIDGFTSLTFTFTGAGSDPGGKLSGAFDQFIYLNTGQLPGGTTPVFQVTGSADNHANEIVIEPSGGGQHLNFSNVTVSDFTRLNQAFWFDFASVANETVIGVPNARNVFHFGGGTNSATGGNLADVFIAGPGHDTFDGGGGIDVAQYHGAIGSYTVTKLAAHKYLVHDNRHGSPDGTDTLVNVEYLEFTNATVYIGGPVTVVHTTSALHTNALAAASVHHFDLFA